MMKNSGDKIIVKTYTGTQATAMGLYQTDSAKMATQGYFPISQSWAPGRWSGGDFFVALVLCLILIGFLVFVYMLIVTPKGTLSVTYELRPSSEEKTCPQCAEKVKAAAILCRFCGYKFSFPDEAPATNTSPQTSPSKEKVVTPSSLKKGTTIALFVLFAVVGSVLLIKFIEDSTGKHEQKLWDQPTKLEGTYHQGHFTNCCDQGKETYQSYNDLTLYNAIDVTDNTNDPDEKLQNITHVQVGATEELIDGINDGDLVIVQCQSLWHGVTGHYALPVYCIASYIQRKYQTTLTPTAPASTH